MNEYYERLTALLLEQNPNLSYTKARTWVELLWEDFETTYAKAGRPYRGKEMAEKIVRTWILQYGKDLHLFATKHSKYAHLLNTDDHITH